MKDRLHRVLIELSAEHGFRDLTVAQLCARARCSEAAFHRAYRDLEECFAEIYKGLTEEFLVRMVAAFDADRPWREQIRAVAHAFVGYLQEDAARARFVAIEAIAAGERVQAIRDSLFLSLFALIDQGRQELADPDSLTAATAESIGGAVFQQIRDTIETEGTAGLPAIVPELMYTVVLPYLGPEAAAEELEIAAPDLQPSRGEEA